MTSTEDTIEKLKSNKFSEIQSALMEIHSKFVPSHEKMKDLMQNGVLQLLISLIDQSQFCEISMSILAEICLTRAWIDEIIELNGINSLIQIILYSTDCSIINEACRAIGNIAKSKINMFTDVHLDNLITRIVYFLYFPQISLFQEMAVRTLRILGGNIRARRLILRNNGIALIAKFLCSSDENLVLECVRALAKLTECRSVIYADQYLTGTFLKDVLELYERGNNEVKMYAIKTLKNLSDIKKIRSCLFNAGVYTFFYKVISGTDSTNNKKIAFLVVCDILNDISIFKGNNDYEMLKVFVEAVRLKEFEDIHFVIIEAIYTSRLLRKEKELIIVSLTKALIQNIINFTSNCRPHDDSVFLCLAKNESSVPSESSPVPSKQFHSTYLVDKNSCLIKKSLEFKYRSVFLPCNTSTNISFKKQSDDASVFTTNTFLKYNHLILSRNSDPFSFLLLQNKFNVQNCKVMNKSDAKSVVGSTFLNDKESLVNTRNACCKKRRYDQIDTTNWETYNNTDSDLKFNKRIADQNNELVFHQSNRNTANRVDKIYLEYLLLLTNYLAEKEVQYRTLVEKSCFISLLLYILCKPNTDSTAEKILLNIIKYRPTFAKLIVNGFVVEIDKILRSIHDQNVCKECMYIRTIHDNLISVVCEEAESDFVIGTLGRTLHVSKNIDLHNALYAVAKVVLSKMGIYQLARIFLEKMCEVFFKNSEMATVNIVFSLCRFYQNLKEVFLRSFPSACCVSTTCTFEETAKCFYEDDVFDITFVVDDGVKVRASVDKICNESPYFCALLNGYFLEKNLSIVVIHEISAETLTAIFHFLHGCCKGQLCPFITEISFESSLELFTECDKFLLSNIQTFAVDRLCHFLSPETAVKIYQHAKNYDSTLLKDKTLNYLLSLDVSETVSFNCFQEFLNLEREFHVMDDVKNFFIKTLS